MTKARLLAEADSYELTEWAALYRIEAEEKAAAGASGNGVAHMAGLAGGL